MTLSVRSAEDVVNLALTRIGYPQRVMNIYEGSRAAKAALAVYAQTRDAVLVEKDWDFAERTASLALLKSAPVGGYIPPTVWTMAFPPPPWLFEYAWPADCLKPRIVRSVPLLLPNMDPVPAAWTDFNDQALNPPARTLLSNIAGAVLTYTGQVTDPTSWKPDFVEALAAALARRLAPGLMGPEAEKLEGADEQVETALAGERDTR